MSAVAPYVVVLGIAQDAGFPVAGCHGPCCAPAWADHGLRRHVSCLGIVDPRSAGRWLIDCTPDFAAQLHALDVIVPPADPPGLSGILLTHAHIGHYAGLIYLGREALDTKAIPVYVMPRMRHFLEQNAPWSQLVADGNIALCELADGAPVRLADHITAEPLLVPHRDELSETVGFRIAGPQRSAVYLPDIDSWERWDKSIEDVVATADAAWLDGTFYDSDELPGREMSTVPHPLIRDSTERFAALPAPERAKIRFIHFNHTNPVIDPASSAIHAVAGAGLGLAEEGERSLL